MYADYRRGFAANLHLMTAARSPWCEFPMEPPWTPDMRDFLLTETFEAEDGYIEAPAGPGLSIEIDWNLIEKRD